MIRWVLILLALSGPVLAQGTGEQRAEAAGQSLIGSPAPRMVLKTIDGQAIDLGKLYGKKAVYLKFWATWCVPCREQMPHFEKTFEARGSDLEVIAINAGFNDSVDDVREYRKRLGIKMPIVIDDGTLGTALNLRVTPQHVVIGRDGRIEYVGHLANEQLEAALVAARKAPAGEKAGVASTAAVKPSVHGVGDTAPAFSVTASNGASFTNKGPVVLVFLSPWCESYLETSRAAVSARCRDVREQVESLAKQHPDVRWLGVASRLWSSQDELGQYAAKYKVTIPLTMDASSAMFNSFHVRRVPTIIAINGSGQIASRIEGNEPGLTAELARVAMVR
ncbi:MAG: TlpA family protein disulfide reductase [Proteobacteria bacterium]|nr:TlpA family protein disulfide reductase [Pseudomonadota bacterium]